MGYLIRHEPRRFRWALALSLALHALVLAIRLSSPPKEIRPDAYAPNSPNAPLDVALAKPARPASPPSPALPKRSLAKPPLHSQSKVLALPPDASRPATAKTWSRAERDEMNQFLSELSTPSRSRSGQDLEQQALAASRGATAPAEDDDELREMAQKFSDAKVDRFSLEMYFDALFRKMNRSAAMVKKEQRAQGAHVAAVRVVVNKDGSLKSFRVLWAADQQAEIAYIKAVINQAAPFPVFPPDIRSATDSIVLQICILPGRYGGGSGATFTRMSSGQSCREPDSG